MGKRTHGPQLIHAIEQNNQKKVQEILMFEIRSKKKIKEILTASCKRPGSDHYACPLLVAASLPDPGLAKYMVVKHEANVNFVYKESNGKIVRMNTALKVAVKGGIYHVVEVLLGLNADPNIPDHKGRSVLFYAVQNADYRMAKMLLSRGAKPNLADNSGNTALHMATRYGHLEMVKLCVKYGGDLYKKGPDGAIPIHIAAREGHTLLVRYFAQNEVNVNVKVPCFEDGKEKAPLHVAAEEGHSHLVQCLLIELNAQIDIRDSEGETPLHCTVIRDYDPFGMKSKEDYADCAKALLKHGARYNAKNLRGETPLHLAARNEFQRVVELLTEYGADPSIKDNDGSKPGDLVSENDTVTKNLLKVAMDNLESRTSETLEIKARGFSTAVNRPAYKTKSAADIFDEPSDGSMERASSMPGLLVSHGSDTRVNGTLQGIYRNGYLEPLGSRETMEKNNTINNYEDLDDARRNRRKRIHSEVRRSREMMIDSSSDSYQTEEHNLRNKQRSKSLDIDNDDPNTSTYDEIPHGREQNTMSEAARGPKPQIAAKPQQQQSQQTHPIQQVSGTLPNQVHAQNVPVRMQHPIQQHTIPGNHPQAYNMQGNVPNQFSQQIMQGIRMQQQTISQNDQDKNNNLNKVNNVAQEPVVNYFQNTEPIEPKGQYNVSVGEPRRVIVPGSPSARRANNGVPSSPNMQRTAPAQIQQTTQRSTQQRVPVMIPIDQMQQQRLQRTQGTTNPVSDSDDTFFDDASFETLSEDNLISETKKVPPQQPQIQHIMEPKSPTDSQVVPLRVSNPRGDPKLMQNWLEEQARLIHRDANDPVARSSPHYEVAESITTVSQSEAGDFDRRFVITLKPDKGGPQQVTINTAELAKKIKPKPAVKPRKSKALTPPPTVPSRDTKPFSSFRGKNPVNAPPEVGRIRNELSEEHDSSQSLDSSGKLHWEKVPAQNGALYWEHKGTEQIYDSVQETKPSLPQKPETGYMDMNSPSLPRDRKVNAVQSPEQLSDASHDTSSHMHPPPSPGTPKRRNSKSKPVSIPVVPGSAGSPAFNTQISMESTRSSRASVDSINTVIYVPPDKGKQTEQPAVTQEKQGSVAPPATQNVEPSPPQPQPRTEPQKQVPPQPPPQEAKPSVTQQQQPQPSPQVTVKSQVNDQPSEGPYEELPADSKKKVSIGHEEVFQETERLDPDMTVIEYDTGDQMQLQIAGGNSEGIFVHRVNPGSEAEKAGLEEGFQIFKVNDHIMKGKTQEDAYLLLMDLKGKITMQVKDNGEHYDRIMKDGGAGDSFYVRCNFDHDGTDDAISFVKGEIVSVKDTMPNGKLGYWRASKLYAKDHEKKSGYMPNQERAEQYAKAMLQSDTIEKEERGNFFRRSIRKSKSAKDKKRERSLSTSSVHLEAPVYERVDQKYPGFIRPVVLLGLFCDYVREKLVTEVPEKFEMPPPEAEYQIRETMNYLEKVRIHENQLAAIKRVIERRRHCVLVVSPKTAQQIIDWDLHPVIIFMSVESKNLVKALKSQMAPKLDKKPSSLYEDSLHFARDFSHIFTVTVPYTTDDSWYTLLKDSIGRIQNLAVWQKVEEEEPSEKMETKEVKTVTTTSSTGQQRVVHYVQQGVQEQNGPTPEPDRSDVAMMRPGPGHQIVRPQPVRPMQQMRPQQYPPHMYGQQQYYYQQQHPYQQQQWMQQQYQQQQRMGYMGGQQRPGLKASDGTASLNMSTDSASTAGTGQSQPRQPLQGQYMAPFQHLQNNTAPRQAAPPVAQQTQYATVQKIHQIKQERQIYSTV